MIKRFLAVLMICTVFVSLGACKKSAGTNGEAVSDVTDTAVPVASDYTEDAVTESTSAAAEQNSVTVSQTKPAPQKTEEKITSVGKYTNNTLSVQQIVYYPDNIQNSEKTYPVIAWANGTMCTYELYEELLKSIAMGGYIVVANGETMAADGTAQRASIDFILSENANLSSVLYQKVNTGAIGAAGHSQGGRSAVNAAAADARIGCVLSVAGSNYKEEAERLSAPVLFTTGTRDLVVAADSWVKPAYKVCKGPAVYVSLKDGVHTSCSAKPLVYSAYAVKWFDAWLKNDSTAKQTFVNGGALSKDTAWTDFACKGL